MQKSGWNQSDLLLLQTWSNVATHELSKTSSSERATDLQERLASLYLVLLRLYQQPTRTEASCWLDAQVDQLARELRLGPADQTHQIDRTVARIHAFVEYNDIDFTHTEFSTQWRIPVEEPESIGP